MITVSWVVGLGLAETLLYVAGYYAAQWWPYAAKTRSRPSANGTNGPTNPDFADAIDLDDPLDAAAALRRAKVENDAIKRRLVTHAIVCLLSAVLLYSFVYVPSEPEPSLSHFLSLIGIRVDNLFRAIAVPVVLILLLFLGPLVQMWMERELFFQDRMVWDLFWHRMSTPMGKRNYAVSPIAEEFVFRACIIFPFYLARIHPTAIILLSPLFFGIAHLHNIYDLYQRNGRTVDALKRAILSTVFQLMYTTVFGWIASFFYVRTGNIIGPALIHMFCNVMGFPDVGSVHLTRSPRTVWTCYVVGLVLFLALMGPLTSPALFRDVPSRSVTY
ncbi:hypothetical protein AMAG_01986 [Allomyces macrogynus ATCC 38327]|uniref:intramembrane prenyl-peptidase Rce1 n=1 Tax=Allomyces macrogynus (strain ATCC 38327) TaxID=578462 RepID=A0A0L0S1B5_ALLM3|nr:hypothetical protein AMAG_01986 [Allomyces macrogynus ATCC 38327]|eukprot:KNE56149.1 hypothetical protein AMAG_01986 [Allomyces macrogynus ATCC 38327]